MRKFTLLLAIVAVAAAPSLASAKTTRHHAAHHAKAGVVAKYKDLNAHTWRLFAEAFAPAKPSKKK